MCQLILNKDSLSRVSLLLSDNHHSHDDNQAIDSQLNEHGLARASKDWAATRMEIPVKK